MALKRILTGTMLLLACYPFAGTVTQTNSEDAKLEFDAKPVKTRFARGEAVDFIFRLRNVGSEQVLVFRSLVLYFAVHLDIRGPDNNPIEWCGRIPGALWRRQSFVMLRPGEKLESRRTVSCEGDEPGTRWGYDLSKPGKYTAHPKYHLTVSESALTELEKKQLYRGPRKALVVEFVIE